MVSQWQIEQAMACVAALRHREAATPDDDELLAMIDEAETDVFALLRSVVLAVQENESLVASIAERMKSLTERKDRFARRAESLRGTVLAMMDAMEIQKHQAPEFTISVGKPRAGLLITDEAEIPEEYTRIKREPDKKKILDDLKEGVVITGAILANGVPTLTVRSK